MIVVSYLNQCSFLNYFLEHDVDGSTLKLLNSVERISVLIPKLKQQLIFLEEHAKLFQKINDCSISGDNELSNESISCQSLVAASANVLSLSAASINTQSAAPDLVNSQSSSVVRKNTTQADQSIADPANRISLPEEYKIPLLPNGLMKDIDNREMELFGPHRTNRRILIDAIAYDLSDRYKCL